MFSSAETCFFRFTLGQISVNDMVNNVIESKDKHIFMNIKIVDKENYYFLLYLYIFIDVGFDVL